MPFQLVSSLPISSSTPSSTSRIASGGILKDRSSLMFSALMEPTAVRAASIIGCTSASSPSTSAAGGGRGLCWGCFGAVVGFGAISVM